MSQSILEQFKQKLDEQRAAQEPPTFEMEFKGLPCKVSPVQPGFYVRSGRMPEYLADAVLAWWGGGKLNIDVDQLSPAQIKEGNEFQRFVVCAVIREPRIVDAPDPEPPALRFADVDESVPGFADEVFAWFLKGCPAPGLEKGGEVLNEEDLSGFSEGGEGGKRPKPRDNRKARRKKAARTPTGAG